eukprot:2448040-Ditylum_brightwellii.AAC.1
MIVSWKRSFNQQEEEICSETQWGSSWVGVVLQWLPGVVSVPYLCCIVEAKDAHNLLDWKVSDK